MKITILKQEVTYRPVEIELPYAYKEEWDDDDAQSYSQTYGLVLADANITVTLHHAWRDHGDSVVRASIEYVAEKAGESTTQFDAEKESELADFNEAMAMAIRLVEGALA